MGLEIEPLSVNSRDISFGEWVSLLTLCLAPLVAQVFAGAPKPSYLVPSMPPWHDRLVLFNPTSILFRYAAIVERRIRAYGWEPVDAAAANALFWTARGWDGSEDMVVASLPYCALPPEHATVGLLSSEMLKTLVVTAQGVQAAVPLVGGLTGAVSFHPLFGVDFAFGPLAILGLMRLSASFWLVDEFLYSTKSPVGTELSPSEDRTQMQLLRRRYSMDSLLCEADGDGTPGVYRYRPNSYWPSRLFCTFYLAVLLCLWLVAGSWIFFRSTIATTIATVTSFLVGLLYFVLLTITIILFACYFFRGQTTLTIIPCTAQTWYKIYTVMLMLFMAAIVIIAMLETNRSICGDDVSYPVRVGHGYSACASAKVLTHVNPNPKVAGMKAFGIASQNNWGQNITGLGLEERQFWVVNFTGVCLGQYLDLPTWMQGSTLGYSNYSNATGTSAQPLS